MQNEDVEYTGGANQVSLCTARNNFIDCGASERRFIQNVRPPMQSELPEVTIIGQLEAHQLAEIRKAAKLQMLAIARAVLSGRIGTVEGSVQLSLLAHKLDPHWIDRINLFVAIDSETDHLPRGDARQHWTADALARKDQELADYKARIRDDVLYACRELEESLRTDLLHLKPVD